MLIRKDGRIVLADLSSAKILQANRNASGAESACDMNLSEVGQYQAPEVILRWAHDYSSDWWGFGLLLCFMLTGKHAFLGNKSFTNMHSSLWESRVLHGRMVADLTESVGPDALDLLSKCLERNPVLRLSEEGIKQHTFFAGVAWDKVGEMPIPGFTACDRPFPFEADVSFASCTRRFRRI